MSDKKSERNIGLDVLKVLATFAVIKLHAGYNGYTSEIIHYICGLAVPVFFMVSGALVLNNRGNIRYAVSRIGRVLFLMFIWNVPFVFFSVLKNRTFVNPVKYVLNALLQRGYLGHFWYLWALIFLYALSPILNRIIINYKYSKIFTCVLVGICFVSSLCTVFLSLDGYRTVEELVPQALRIWSHVTYFWLGGVIFRWLKKVKPVVSKYVLYGAGLYVINVAVVEFIICKRVLKLHSPENMFTSLIVIALACLVFIVGCSVNPTQKIKQIFENLIGLSLGMYIVHPFFIAMMQHFHLWNDKMWILNFVVLSVCSGIATAIIKKIPYLRRTVTL